MQTSESDWYAGDIRYIVLRVTSSPKPPFGGYGPAFVNLRTWQILGADIMLEYVYFTNRVKYEKLYDAQSERDKEKSGFKRCHAGSHLKQGNFFGKLAVGSIGDYSELEQRRILYESLVRLTLHEIGHTHGLNHNFASSYFHSFNNIHDRHITEPVGLTSSVMEYPSINVGTSSNAHGQFYTTVPGPYDLWAIDFGYTPSLKNPEDEKERVQKLLSQSSKPELMIGNDSDDMRYPGRGIDLRIMRYDLSDDPVAYAQQRMDVIRSLYPKLRSRYEVKNDSYHSFKDAFLILNREYSQSATIISRQIGGVHMDRAMIGEAGKEKPFLAVPKDQQKWAMTLLNKYLFSPDAFKTPDGVFNYLQWERRGFSGTKDPNILDMYLNMQKNIFNHVLNMKVMKRISNVELYGNKYGLTEVFHDLTTSCFSADAGTNVNSMRRNLQVEYANRLIQIVHNKGKNKYDHLSVATAYENLNKIKKYASRFNGVDEPTKAHRKYLIYIIEKALKV